MNVYFTVDTEVSMGGAWVHHDRRPLGTAKRIFCRIGDQDYGIPLIVRILKEHGFRGTFFTETLATRCLGAPEIQAVFDYLLTKGQDVQLHLHPTYRFYPEWLEARARGEHYQIPKPTDLLGHLPEDLQRELLEEAAGYFRQYAGYAPSVFRAGCYAGSRSMLRCLAAMGIHLDSSFNPCYPKLSFPGEHLTPNLVQKIEGVWEIPLTVAKTPLPEAHHGFKFMDCTALSFSEVRGVLERAAAAGQKHFVMVFHSFSAVKAKDETYADMRPNYVVIRRLERLFAYLAGNPAAFQVRTMDGLALELENSAVDSAAAVSDLSFGTAARRKVVQLLNTPYWI